MSRIEIYTTGLCPYCVRARRLLDKKGVAFADIRVDLEPARRQEMERRSGRDTVPQVFVDGRGIGGFDDMIELEMDGELDGLLGIEEAGG